MEGHVGSPSLHRIRICLLNEDPETWNYVLMIFLPSDVTDRRHGTVQRRLLTKGVEGQRPKTSTETEQEKYRQGDKKNVTVLENYSSVI